MKKFVLLYMAMMASAVLMAQEIKTIDQAIVALQDGRYTEAKTFLQKRLAEFPRDHNAAYPLSIALYNLGEYDEQFRVGDIVLRYSSNTVAVSWVWQQRGQVYYSRGDWENAVDAFSYTIKCAPSEQRGYLWRSQVCLILARKEMSEANALDSIGMRLPKSKIGEKYLKLAEKDARKVLKFDASSVGGFSMLGEVYYIRGNEAEAERYCQKAIATGSNVSSCYTNLFHLYIKQQKYAEAADLLVSIIEKSVEYEYTHYFNAKIGRLAFQTLNARYQIQANKHRDDGTWPYYIGLLYEDVEENHEKAAEYFKKAYALEPQYSYTASAAANAFLNYGNYHAAIAYAQRAITLYDSSASSYATIATAKYRLGEPDSAVYYITQAIHLAPTYFWYYYRRGFFHDNLRHYDEAIDDYSTALELENNYAYAYMARGDMYRATGKRMKAEADYRKAIALDSVPQKGSCAMYAHLSLGDTVAAINFLNRYIEANTDKGSAYYEAACLYSRMGRIDEALQYLEKSFVYGNSDYAHMQLDDDLDPLRNTDAYRRILDAYKPKPFPEEPLPPLSENPTEGFKDILRSIAPQK